MFDVGQGCQAHGRTINVALVMVMSGPLDA